VEAGRDNYSKRRGKKEKRRTGDFDEEEDDDWEADRSYGKRTVQRKGGVDSKRQDERRKKTASPFNEEREKVFGIVGASGRKQKDANVSKKRRARTCESSSEEFDRVEVSAQAPKEEPMDCWNCASCSWILIMVAGVFNGSFAFATVTWKKDFLGACLGDPRKYLFLISGILWLLYSIVWMIFFNCQVCEDERQRMKPMMISDIILFSIVFLFSFVTTISFGLVRPSKDFIYDENLTAKCYFLPKEDEVKNWNAKFEEWARDKRGDKPVTQDDIDSEVSWYWAGAVVVFSITILELLCWVPTVPIVFGFVAGRVKFDRMGEGS
jgi:hypothetical protein